jgi:hypothetical protein
LIEGTVAHYGLWQGVRPGLEEGLITLRKELAAVSDRVEALSKEHIALAGDNAKEKSKEWSQIRESLAASRQLLKQLDDRYSLSPEEQMVLMRMAAERLAELSVPPPDAPVKKATKADSTNGSKESRKDSSSEKSAEQNSEKNAVSESTPDKSNSQKGSAPKR